MNADVLDAIRTLLRCRGVAFEERSHEPVYTSEQAAAARGEPMELGGKAIVAKVGKEFQLFVLSAALQINARAICRHLHEDRFRFASREELAQLTGLTPGCVPPFGEPILPLPLHVDRSMSGPGRIAFNAGSHRVSMLLDREDWLAAARPVDVFDFSRPPG